MSNEHNIDKLLKESFDNFSPEAPDVWQAVQQGVQAAQASGGAASSVAATAAKGVGVKVISGIVMVAASVAGYTWYQLSSVSEEVPAKPKTEVVVENTVSQPEVIVEQTPLHQPQSDVVAPVTQSIKQQPKKIKKQQRAEVAEPTIQKADIIEEISFDKPQSNQESETVMVQSVQQVVAPSNLTSSSTANQQESKDKMKKPVPAPYNPYSEEGEEYEKPVIPGSFSPNGDGLNDRFEVMIENESFFHIMILNEKGELMFESKSKDHTWDGRHYKTGVKCEAGKYFYRLKYQYKGSEKVHEKSDLIAVF